MSVRAHDTVEVGYDELCGALAAKDLQPLWTQAAALMPERPTPATLPWLWKWRTVLPLAERAGQLIDITRGGDRRVLAFANPGLHGLPYTSSTLWGAFQYLGAHETAPAHRHSPAALRFVLEGEGVWTTVQGDACDMSAGDLILTPSGRWHDHTNGSDRPMVWFDGLDLPLVGALEAVFFEVYPDRMQPVRQPHNLSERLYGGRGTQPLATGPMPSHSPLLLYRWADTDAALSALLESGPGPMVSLRYANPTTGGGVLPTLGCEMHRIVPGEPTPPHRKVGSSIYVVYGGHGHSVINGQRFDWERGDVFVTPSWSTVEHRANELADLFAVTDRPVLEALHLFREESPAEAQQVVATFEPR